MHHEVIETSKTFSSEYLCECVAFYGKTTRIYYINGMSVTEPELYHTQDKGPPVHEVIKIDGKYAAVIPCAKSDSLTDSTDLVKNFRYLESV